MSEYYEDYSAEDLARWRREHDEAMKAGPPDPNINLFDEADVHDDMAKYEAGKAAFEKVFKPTYVGKSNSNKEVRSMSDQQQVKGLIEAKKVDGNRYGYKVDGKWVSCFVRDDTPEEVVQTLKTLDKGDDVTFSVYENKGYLNIDGVVEFTKGDPSKVKPAGGGYSFRGSGGGGKGGYKSSWKQEDKRPGLVTMTFSYAKDQIVEILKSADMSNQAPEAMLKFAEEQTPRLAKVYLEYAIREAKALGWSLEPKE